MDTEEILKKHKEESREYKSRKARKDVGVERSSYKHILSPKYKSLIARANGQGLSFDLTQEDVDTVLNTPCCFCGRTGNGCVARVHFDDGFTKDNILPSCSFCSLMRGGMEVETFLRAIKKIHSFRQLGKMD